MPPPIINKAAICSTGCHTAHAHVTAAKQGVGTQFTEFFSNLFNTSDWPPRWHCGKWSDFHGWLYIVSDVLIWLSYYIIPIMLITLITRRKDIPYPKLILLFVVFIVACGTTHLFDAIIFWWPAYRISAMLKFITAVVSVAAVFALYKILPLLLNLRTVQDLEKEIAERKVVEQKLADNELILNQSLDLLSTHNQQLKNFTHILSHNIRNHASNISLLTDMIDEEKLDEDNLEITQKIKTVSERLNTTLDDLSTVIKIRETVLERETLYFSEITQKVLEVLQSDVDANEAVIDLNFEAQTVHFPGIYMESIIMNLISNSIKYRKPDVAPHISIRTFTENNRTVLTHTDNGIGIDLQLHGEKMFGLYKTFHHHKNAHGVGLFLIRNQIESQGGTITVNSKPNEGTTFKITFNEQT